MNLTTRAQDFELTAAIDRFARSSIENALTRLSADIIAIDIFFKDTNGPKGGIDKHALIRVQLRDRQTIAINTSRDDLYAAIKAGTARAKRAVRRHVRRTRRIERHRPPQIFDASA